MLRVGSCICPPSAIAWLGGSAWRPVAMARAWSRTPISLVVPGPNAQQRVLCFECWGALSILKRTVVSYRHGSCVPLRVARLLQRYVSGHHAVVREVVLAVDIGGCMLLRAFSRCCISRGQSRLGHSHPHGQKIRPEISPRGPPDLCCILVVSVCRRVRYRRKVPRFSSQSLKACLMKG